MNKNNELFGRDLTVDVLRGVAIFLVLLLHFHLAYRIDQGLVATILPPLFLKRLASNGNFGVTIFFVISGYLITHRMLDRFGSLRRISLGDFYSFRVGRIIPNIFLMTATVVFLGFLGLEIFQNNDNSANLSLTIISIVTFTHNLLMQKYGYFNYCLNILWSLSVEEMFYLCFPLVCLALRRHFLIALAFMFFAVLGPIYRHFHSNDEIVALYNYFSCFDGIAIGCLVALIKRKHAVPLKAQWPLRTVAILVIVGVYFYSGIMKNVVFGVSLIAVSTGLIIFASSSITQKSSYAKAFRPWTWLGRHSYELYLFHVVILALMKVTVPKESLGYYMKPAWFFVYLFLSSLVAYAVARLYANPLNRFFRKTFKLKIFRTLASSH